MNSSAVGKLCSHFSRFFLGPEMGARSNRMRSGPSLLLFWLLQITGINFNHLLN